MLEEVLQLCEPLDDKEGEAVLKSWFQNTAKVASILLH
jgi:hypothetical protein